MAVSDKHGCNTQRRLFPCFVSSFSQTDCSTENSHCGQPPRSCKRRKSLQKRILTASCKLLATQAPASNSYTTLARRYGCKTVLDRNEAQRNARAEQATFNVRVVKQRKTETGRRQDCFSRLLDICNSSHRKFSVHASMLARTPHPTSYISLQISCVRLRVMTHRSLFASNRTVANSDLPHHVQSPESVCS